MYKDGLSKLLLLQRFLCFRIDGHAHPERQHSRNVWLLLSHINSCKKPRVRGHTKVLEPEENPTCHMK